MVVIPTNGCAQYITERLTLLFVEWGLAAQDFRWSPILEIDRNIEGLSQQLARKVRRTRHLLVVPTIAPNSRSAIDGVGLTDARGIGLNFDPSGSNQRLEPAFEISTSIVVHRADAEP